MVQRTRKAVPNKSGRQQVAVDLPNASLGTSPVTHWHSNYSMLPTMMTLERCLSTACIHTLRNHSLLRRSHFPLSESIITDLHDTQIYGTWDCIGNGLWNWTDRLPQS